MEHFKDPHFLKFLEGIEGGNNLLQDKENFLNLHRLYDVENKIKELGTQKTTNEFKNLKNEELGYRQKLGLKPS